MGGEANNVSNKRRRNRVAVSCFSCRTLKTKCDGVRPVCSTCTHNGRHCTFLSQGISKGASKNVLVREDYLQRLEKRLELLEGAAFPRVSGAMTTPAPPATDQDPRVPVSIRSPSSPATVPTETGSSPMLVDANVSIGGISFTQFILSSLHRHDASELKAQSMMTNGEIRGRQSVLTLDDLFTLPDNTPEVLDLYFSCRNDINPLFHEPSTRPILEAAMRCPPEERHLHRSAFIILNMILALCTSHWLVDVEENAHTARKHYDIAMTLLQPTLLRDWTLGHVQALLIGAVYLQGTGCGDECWSVLGLAIRTAQGLNLHKEPCETDPPPLRETKRRVWYAAYTLDMHWSMVYERPPATRSSEFSVCMPEDLDDDCIQPDRVLYPTPRRPSFMSFFLENVKLYRIVEKAMALLSKSKLSHRETAELVTSLDEDYQKWLRERPAHLILDYNDAKVTTWILALRGKMAHILIHRQSLKVGLDDRGKPGPIEDSTVNHILRSSQRLCVAAAMESIDIVYLRHEQTKNIKGLNWFNVYYLFNAVIALVSYIINPFYSHDQPALDKMDKALHMIKSMSKNHSFATRAYSFLQQVIGYMHQSLESQRPKPTNSMPPGNDTHTQATEPVPTTATPGGAEGEGIHDLHTLFGFAQNLTDGLETQLEDFGMSGLSESMWTFNDEGAFDTFSQRI